MFRWKPSCCFVCARPPSECDCSSRITDFPLLAKKLAAASPETPPPMTITSDLNLFVIIFTALLDHTCSALPISLTTRLSAPKGCTDPLSDTWCLCVSYEKYEADQLAAGAWER